jgi:serine/threonine protein phosphatase PrpC
MKIVPGNAQHIGDRKTQEDAFGFSHFGDRAFEGHGGVMMVLCDGMGGLSQGAEASRIAVDTILSAYQRKPVGEAIPAAIARAIGEAQQAVCGLAGDGAAGTTVVIAVIWRNELHWGSLGDSRLYLCRRRQPAEQLTVDHNVACDPRAGVPGDANGEALTRYLGAPEDPVPDTGRRGLHPGDRVLACSDGVYRAVSPEEMSMLARRGDAMTAAEKMAEQILALRIPHQDNLTITLLDFRSTGWLRLPALARWIWITALVVLALLAALVLAVLAYPQAFPGKRAVERHPKSAVPTGDWERPKDEHSPMTAPPTRSLESPSVEVPHDAAPPRPTVDNRVTYRRQQTSGGILNQPKDTSVPDAGKALEMSMAAQAENERLKKNHEARENELSNRLREAEEFRNSTQIKDAKRVDCVDKISKDKKLGKKQALEAMTACAKLR